MTSYQVYDDIVLFNNVTFHYYQVKPCMNLEYRSEHAQYLECHLVCEVVFAAPDIPVLNSLC